MNSKMIAAAMAIAMAFVGFAVVSGEGSDAVTTIDADVATGGTYEQVIGYNEGNYTHYGYEIEWTLKFDSYSGTIATIEQGETANMATDDFKTLYVGATGIETTKKNDSYFSIGMERVGTDIGKYTITIEGIKETSNTVSFTLAASTTVTINSGSQELSPVTYNGSVNVIKTNTSEAIEVSLADATATVGTYYNQQIEVAGSYPDYQWYAIGLPEGLSMSKDGYVSGIPTAATQASVSDTFKVFGTDLLGNVVYDSSVSLTVNLMETGEPETPYSFVYKLYEDGTQSTTMIFDSGSEVILKLNETGKTDSITDATVKVINDDFTTVADTVTYSEVKQGYVIPTDGTGSYTISVTSQGQTQYFRIYVVANATDITANIVIEGA